MPKCLFVNTYHSGFLAAHLVGGEGLSTRTYAELHESLMAAKFGASDYGSAGLRKAGWIAADIVVNCEPLGRAWARENGSAAAGLGVAIEQARALAPDVVYVKDLNATPREFFNAVRPRVGLLVAETSTPIGAHVPIDAIDLVISSLPTVVSDLRAAGVAAAYQPLAFSSPSSVAEVQKPWSERPTDVSFVGGVSSEDPERTAFLEALTPRTPIRVWGYGKNSLPASSSLRARHGGEAWGAFMQAKLGDSKLTVNRHARAGRYANNRRLFEATGAGALLVTDFRDNLDELFVIGEEVVAYRSAGECASLVQYYLRHPERGERIARAGQARTLRDHHYDKRMQETAALLSRHLRSPRDAAFAGAA